MLFLDADDWLAPDALARLAAALDGAPDAVAATAGFAFVPERAAPGSADLPKRARAAPGGDLLPALLERNLFANGGHVLVRGATLARAGGFRAGLAYGEDWECWCRLALLGRFAAAPGRAPALFVRQRAGGAYLRMASDPAAFLPCMDAIFGAPALLARFGSDGLAAIRRRTEAENRWIMGRELVRHGRSRPGRALLRRSVAEKPGLKRAALLAAAHALALLPPDARGPFRPYRLGRLDGPRSKPVLCAPRNRSWREPLAKFTFPVEASHIMMFARSVLDENPVYHDAAKAKAAEVGGIIAPPTFAQAVAQFDPEYYLRPKAGEKWFGSAKGPSGVDEKPSSSGGLHAEQHFEYHRPLRPGDVLTVEKRPGNTWEKESKRAGKLMFSEQITEYRDQKGELVVTARSVGVRTERPVDAA